MAIGITFMVIAILIIAIWVLVELKRLRHKLFAIFLIFLILFLYVTISLTLRGEEVDLKTTEGITKASKLYLSWMGSALGNMKTITTNAIKMDWNAKNESIDWKIK